MATWPLTETGNQTCPIFHIHPPMRSKWKEDAKIRHISAFHAVACHLKGNRNEANTFPPPPKAPRCSGPWLGNGPASPPHGEVFLSASVPSNVFLRVPPFLRVFTVVLRENKQKKHRSGHVFDPASWVSPNRSAAVPQKRRPFSFST